MKRSWFITLLLLTPLAWAQLSYKGEVTAATSILTASTDRVLSETVALTLRGHLEADWALSPITFSLMLDPSARVPGKTELEFAPGLTEAFALWREGNVDVSAGVERLPLETARLSVPFSVEPLGENGLPQGLPSARVSLFTGSWRFRPMIFYDDRVGGVLSVRRGFGDFELEAHALYNEGTALGLGGSGLVGEVVLYGEAWLLFGEAVGGRGALGASSFWGDALWTLEAAYAPLLRTETAPFPQLLGQLNVPQGDAGSWNVNVGVGLAGSVLKPGKSVLQGLASASYTHVEADYGATVSLNLSHTELATVYDLRFEVTGFF